MLAIGQRKEVNLKVSVFETEDGGDFLPHKAFRKNRSLYDG